MTTHSVLLTSCVILWVSTGLAHAGLEDNRAEADAPAPVERILDEWQRRAAARTSLDVRFTGRNLPEVREEAPFSGRVILQAKGRTLVEIVSGGKENGATSTERILWTDGAMHLLRLERKEHILWPIAAKDRERLPAVLVLPFFWNLNAEALKAKYRVELVKEEVGTWFLVITPLAHAGEPSFSRAYLELDRANYVPTRYVVVSPDRKSWKEYRVTQSHIDQPVAAEVFAIPDDAGWTVMDTEEARPAAWLYRLLTRNGSPELLP